MFDFGKIFLYVHPNKSFLHLAILLPTNEFIELLTLSFSDNNEDYLCGENIWEKETFYGDHFHVDFISDKSGVRNGFLIGFRELNIIHDDL